MDTADFFWMKKSSIKGIWKYDALNGCFRETLAWMKENPERLGVPETGKRKRVAYYGDEEDENFKRRKSSKKIPIEDAPMVISCVKGWDVEKIEMTVQDTIEEVQYIRMTGGMFNWKAVDCDVLSTYLDDYDIDLEEKHTLHWRDKSVEKEIADSADLRATIATL